jgi:hypothetical protein
MARRFRLLDDSGVCAEGFQASDGRCVALSVRVITQPVLYKSDDHVRGDWRAATFEWLDEPEAAVAP